LHNEELYNFYSSPNIIIMITSRRMVFAGHIARVEVKRMLMGFWWESRRKETARET
jgi:hypothetical protein